MLKKISKAHKFNNKVLYKIKSWKIYFKKSNR